MAEQKREGFFKRMFKRDEEGGHRKIKSIICVVLFVVIIGIFISTLLPKKTESQSTSAKSDTKFCALDYCHELEDRLQNVLLSVKGIGKVKVFVMVAESPTYTYLEEGSEQSGDSQSSNQFTIFESRNGSITSPVLVKEELPEILGVLVVATGAKDIKMQTTLTNVVANVLSISISKVEVLEGKA